MKRKKIHRRVRLDWIPLDVSFPRGRKAVALGIATGTPLAWAYVVQLWTWASENARDGIVTGPDAVGVLEHGAGWNGTSGLLVECMALPHINLLDHLSAGYRIHDWDLHTGRHIRTAQANAERNAEKQKRYRERNRVLPGNGEGKKGKGKGKKKITPVPIASQPEVGLAGESIQLRALRKKLTEELALEELIAVGPAKEEQELAAFFDRQLQMVGVDQVVSECMGFARKKREPNPPASLKWFHGWFKRLSKADKWVDA